jgi:hypothetical protein
VLGDPLRFQQISLVRGHSRLMILHLVMHRSSSVLMVL